MKDSRYLQLALETSGLLLLLILNHAHAVKVKRCKLDITRLPREVLPQHYELSFNISNSDKQTFDGEVQIDVSLNFAPKCNNIQRLINMMQGSFPRDSWPIILHADRELEIRSVNFTATVGATSREIEVRTICRDPLKNLLKVEIARNHKNLPKRGCLRFSFSGPIKKEPTTAFDDGFNSRLIPTQFDPPSTRKIFPCFDEPDFKAIFDVSIQLPSELTVLSNMEVASTEGDELDGFKRVRFHTTPVMSPYFLAFAVSELACIEDESEGVKLAIWTPPGRTESAKPHLKTAVRAYEELQKYFQIEQPLKKIDFVAVNVQRGAMGNWGMVTFEPTLMAGQGHLSPDDSYRVSLSLVRELALSWFEDLVTMKWWRDMWLNEGLAFWISRVVLSKILPDYDHQMFYLLDTMMPALDCDTLNHAAPHLKTLQPKTAEQYLASLNTVIYNKAESVVNMLADYLGAPVFQEGIRNYISENRYRNVVAEFLWNDLRQASSIDVAKLMDSWLYQSSYPILRVNLLGVKKQYQLFMNQSRFLSGKFFDGPLWTIPITMMISGGEGSEPTTEKFMLSERRETRDLPPWFDPAEHWLKLNANVKGYYRVEYCDKQLLNTLRRAVKSKQIPPVDRLNLIDDAKARFSNNIMPIGRFREMIMWFSDEDEDGVIVGLVKAVRTLDTVGKKKDGWGADILLRYYEQNGRVRFNPRESELKVKARADVLQYLVHETRFALARNDCYKLYNSLKESGQPIPSPFSDSIFASVAEIGTEDEVERLLEEISNIECRPLRVSAARSVSDILQRGEGDDKLQKFGEIVRTLVES